MRSIPHPSEPRFPEPRPPKGSTPHIAASVAEASASPPQNGFPTEPPGPDDSPPDAVPVLPAPQRMAAHSPPPTNAPAPRPTADPARRGSKAWDPRGPARPGQKARRYLL